MIRWRELAESVEPARLLWTILDESGLLAHYEKVSGLSTENIHYYLVLANWKLGIVLEKTYAAAVKDGGADPKIKEAFGAMVPDLISTAARLAQSGEES